jgi:hypothetical protein
MKYEIRVTKYEVRNTKYEVRNTKYGRGEGELGIVKSET